MAIPFISPYFDKAVGLSKPDTISLLGIIIDVATRKRELTTLDRVMGKAIVENLPMVLRKGSFSVLLFTKLFFLFILKKNISNNNPINSLNTTATIEIIIALSSLNGYSILRSANTINILATCSKNWLRAGGITFFIP